MDYQGTIAAKEQEDTPGYPEFQIIIQVEYKNYNSSVYSEIECLCIYAFITHPHIH